MYSVRVHALILFQTMTQRIAKYNEEGNFVCEYSDIKAAARAAKVSLYMLTKYMNSQRLVGGYFYKQLKENEVVPRTEVEKLQWENALLRKTLLSVLEMTHCDDYNSSLTETGYLLELRTRTILAVVPYLYRESHRPTGDSGGDGVPAYALEKAGFI